MDEQFLRTKLPCYTKPLASSVLELHETGLVVLHLFSGLTSIIIKRAGSLCEEISLNSLLQHKIKKAQLKKMRLLWKFENFFVSDLQLNSFPGNWEQSVDKGSDRQAV